MKNKKIFINFMILLLSLWLILIIGVSAQGPQTDSAEVNQQGNKINTSGLADSVPSGYETVYIFSGVRNKTGQIIATVVHCTNSGLTSIDVATHFFDRFGSTTYPITKTSLASNQSWTFLTQDTQIYDSNKSNAVASDINQGSGRVIATSSNLICTAMILDANNATPQFVTELTLFDENGDCASNTCIPLTTLIYLPVILK